VRKVKISWGLRDTFYVLQKSGFNKSLAFIVIKPLTPELNPSAQRCQMGFFTGDFAS
jgi:hypothetical protein